MRTWTSYRRHLMSAMGLLPVVACDVEGGPEGLPLDDVPPPGLTVAQAGPLLTGAAIDFQVTGAAPGATVYLAGGTTVGPGPCPPVLGGTCLDITTPGLIGQAVANGAGEATITGMLPHQLDDGLSLKFQAVHTGAASTPITEITSHPTRVCGEHEWLDANNYYTETEVFTCGPRPSGGSCPAATSITSQQEAWLFKNDTGFGPLWVGFALEVDCRETSVEDECCYHAFIVPGPVIGRPFEVGGTSRLAVIGGGDGWCEDLSIEVEGLSPEAREAITHAWVQHARGEHASVAAFARFVLQLMQVGAPAGLVAEATRAMGDEITHARMAFSVASALADRDVSAGVLDTSGALDAMDLESIVRATVREGCIGETIAAAQAAVARDGCAVPAVRQILSAIADDESRHAALAWRFVRWVVGAHPELSDVVADEMARGLQAATPGEQAHADALRAWGQLPDADMHAVARQVFGQVVLPCARALVSGQPDAEEMMA